jgi:putative sporulation protein YyaC
MEIHYQNSFAVLKIGHCLSEYLNKNSAIVCIGTDKCIVDSIGPLVGTLLSKKNLKIDIYGTLDKPVQAMNLEEYIKKINLKNYDNILAIDACLSCTKEQGIIEIRKGPVTPGKGIGKILSPIGDFSIIGVDGSSETEFSEIVQQTRLSLVYNMAEIITEGIVTAIQMREEEENKSGQSFLEKIYGSFRVLEA